MSNVFNNTYDNFMKKYNEDHKYCPKCGSNDFTTTLVGYIFDQSNPRSYKDKNIYKCLVCKNIHIRHDRISDKKLRIFKLKQLIK